MIIGSVVSEELRLQDFGTDGRTDRRTDGVNALLDLLSPSATQVEILKWDDKLQTNKLIKGTLP